MFVDVWPTTLLVATCSDAVTSLVQRDTNVSNKLVSVQLGLVGSAAAYEKEGSY